jgi:4-hydroxy-4-methyl-2-oxoglutarate aldolase
MRLNNLGIVRRTIVRVDRVAVDKLSRYSVATIHETMGRVGLMKPYIRPVLFDCIGLRNGSDHPATTR